MVKKERHAILQAQTVSTCFNMIRHAKWSTPSTGFSQLAAVLLKFTSRMTLMAPSRCTSSCRSKRWAGRFLLLAVGSLWGCRCFANLWEELFHSPAQWLDFRVEKAQGKRNPRFPDFKRTEDGEALWINSRNTPAWVEEKLSEAGKLWKSDHKSGGILSSSYTEALWQDLIDSHQDWEDFRATKTVPRFPDFKRKGDGRGLWLDSPNTPEWATEELVKIEDKLEVGRPARQHLSSQGEEAVWRDLINSHQDWEDFRATKTVPRFPDFKRKGDGRGLWLDSPNTPEWATEELVKIEDKLEVGRPARQHLSSQVEEAVWRDLINSHQDWEDFRAPKTVPRFPDFKRKGDGRGLWLDRPDTPEWAAEELVKIEDKLEVGRPARQHLSSQGEEAVWRDLINSHQDWEDFRATKTVPRFPDFKRKGDGRGLWLDSPNTPDWVAEELVRIEDKLEVGRPARQHLSSQGEEAVQRDLINSHQDWYDFRATKTVPRFPDFKRKGDGRGLWLDSPNTPEWATEELVKIEDKLEVGQPARQHLSSQGEEAVWRDLINSHQDWEDFRAFKPFPGFPDFKRKGDGRGLWLDSPNTPEWAAEELVKIEDKLEVGRPAWQHIRSCN